MLQHIIKELKTSAFYEVLRRLRLVYSVMDKRGKKMVLLIQINQVAMILVRTLGLVSIAAFLIMISRPEIITGNRYLRMLHQAIGFETEAHFLVFIGGLLVLAVIFHQVAVVFSSWFGVRLVEGISRHCTIMLYRYYLTEGYESHIQRGTASVIGKGLMATRGTVNSEINKIAGFIANILNIVAIFCGLFFINSQAVLILIVSALLFYVIFFLAYKREAGIAGKEIFRERMKQVRLVKEGASAATEIRLMGKEREFTQEVHNSLVYMAQKSIRQTIIGGIPQRAIWTVSICVLYVIAMYILVNDSPQKAFTVLALFAAGIFRLLPSLQSIFSMLIAQVATSSQFETIMKDLQLAKKHIEDNRKYKKPFQLVQVKDKIVFDNVNYKYPKTNKRVIKNLSFSLPANKIVALFGRSGVGKTTVIRLLSGLLFPQEGRVLVDGRAFQGDPVFTRNWQNSSSFVLQTPFFMDSTLAMNIAFEAKKDRVDYKRAHEAAKLAQLEHFIKSLPNGLDTEVTENAELLSGGQRQRLAIARALYKDSSLLVLDEATNALDLVVEKKIISSLMNIGENKMVIIIAHRPETMRFADIVLVMKEDGSLAQGSYEELIAQDPDFCMLVGTTRKRAAS